VEGDEEGKKRGLLEGVEREARMRVEG